jgi:alkylation response protein AidB-like acyl-CoA dehydrogenase
MRESGAIVVGWLTKLIAGLAVVGVVGFDVVAIMAADVTLTDNANTAAEAANKAWVDSHGSVQAAYDAALAVAAQHHAQAPVHDFSITRDGTVHLRLTRTATTLLVQHIGPLKKQADVSAKGEAHTPAN